MTTRLFATALPALLTFTFTLPAPAAAQALQLEPLADQVRQYQRLDFRVEVPRAYANPFDPDEVDLRLVIRQPDGTSVELPAFFGQPYERKVLSADRRRGDWMYPVGEALWQARFAPRQVGRYEAVAVLRDGQGRTQSAAVAFKALAGDSPGFLGVSRRDPRWLEFSSGRPFFPIGQNIAFVGCGQYVSLGKLDEMFQRMAENGANYVRIWTCCEDWAMAIEARKSAWGRSWHWRPPFAPLPDAADPATANQCVYVKGGESVAVSPSHEVALRPGERYVAQCRVWTDRGAGLELTVDAHRAALAADAAADRRWRTVRLEFTAGENQHWLGRMALRCLGSGAAWIADLSLQAAGGGPELLWEADPNRRVLTNYNPLDCFMLDEVVAMAERRGVYLQLCVLTRDLYMNRLTDPQSDAYRQATEEAKKTLRYAVARWGHSTHVAAWEYFNEMNPGLPTDLFYAELGKYLEQVDPYGHLRTTSAWGPAPKDHRHPQLDIADVHFYYRPTDRNRLADEVDAALDRARHLREHAPNKPALLGEFGLADDQWRPTEEMRRNDSVLDFHNGLWASSLSGTSGSALFWWWDRLDPRDHYPHYRPLASFVADVPWTTAELKPAAVTADNEQVRALGLAAQDRAYLWLFHRRASWDHVVVRGEAPPRIDGVKIRLEGLAAGLYRIEWWDTRSGDVIQRRDLRAAVEPVEIVAPPFDYDVACKITPYAAGP